jgi:DNA-binding NtrC family response regulator
LLSEVLIIDDNKLTRWAFARVLARAGYRVQEVETAHEGLARVKEAPPDLVFLDCHLPDGDGAAVLQALQDLRPMLPVVMTSAEMPQEAAGCLCRLGARGFLAKPCTPALVVALADALLSREVRPDDVATPA